MHMPLFELFNCFLQLTIVVAMLGTLKPSETGTDDQKLRAH